MKSFIFLLLAVVLQTRAQVVVPFENQINSTGWVFIDCDPTQNLFMTQYFNGLVGIGNNGPSTMFEFLANCEGGSLTPQPASALTHPLGSQSVIFYGVQGTSSSQFSIVGQTCQFVLNARIVDPLTSTITYVTVDSVTQTCGPQGASCDCSFFNVFCYIDCDPVGSAFFWICIYFITIIVGLFIIWLPIEHEKTKKKLDMLQQFNARESVIQSQQNDTTHKNISDLTGKIERGEVNLDDLAAEYQAHEETLTNPEVSGILRDRQLELMNNERYKAFLAKKDPGVWNFVKGKMGKFGEAKYEYLPDDSAQTIEMKTLSPGYNKHSQAQFPASTPQPFDYAGPSSGGAFRRARKSENSQSRKTQVQNFLETDTD